MKKFLTLLLVFAMVSFFGCKKPTGTLNLDNYSYSSVSVSWDKYTLSCGPLGYTSKTVESGTHRAYGYSGGVSIGSLSITVPEDGSKTIYIYSKKSSEGNFELSLEKPNFDKPLD